MAVTYRLDKLQLTCWILAAFSLLGAILIAMEHAVLGLMVWSVINVGWVYYFIRTKQYPSAVLFAAYEITSVWGVINWLS